MQTTVPEGGFYDTLCDRGKHFRTMALRKSHHVMTFPTSPSTSQVASEAGTTSYFVASKAGSADYFIHRPAVK